MLAKLTKRTVDGLQEVPGELVWDTVTKGFGVRVKKSGSKSFCIRYTDKGREQRYTIGAYGPWTVDDARKEATKLLGDVARGKNPAELRKAKQRAGTVAELCDEYLAGVEKGEIMTRRGEKKRTSTLYTDRGRVERHIKRLLGRRAIKDVTSKDIRDFQRDVTAGRTAADVKTGLRGRAIVTGGAGTARRTMGLLGAIFRYSVEQGYRPDNPVSGVQRSKDGKRKVDITETHYRAIGAALEAATERGEPWQATEAIRMIALTGCRKGEIENLRKAEVDLQARCLRLEQSKTGESVRPLGGAAATALQAVMERARGDYVFARRAKPYSGLDKALKRIFADTEASHLTAHSLRHGFASIANRRGLTLPTIAALMGHGCRGVTHDYIHNHFPLLLEAADNVAGAIDRAMKGDDSGKVLEFPARQAPA